MESPLFVGVDVGGTSIKIGIVDDQGKTLAKCSLDTEAGDHPRVAIAGIQESIQRLAEEIGRPTAELTRIGLGTPGSMDIPAGMILEPPNLPGWRHFPIRDELAKATGIPVTFSNDANAAAFGEYWIGGGQKFRSIVMLTLGTGVGGGIIINDVAIEGEHSHGAECGHVPIDNSANARVCSCGLKGHLEAYASATALIKRCEEALRDGVPSSLAEPYAAGEDIDGLRIAQAAESGDPLAHRLILETADYLAIGVAIFLNTIDPSAIVLGGAMNFGGESHPIGRQFIERVRVTSRNMTLPVVAENAQIVFAELAGDAGYIGAAGLAREAFHRSRKSGSAKN